jgi:peptidoglycan/LPS O-acetylase OafA/YrhL
MLHAFTKDLGASKRPPVILPRVLEYFSAGTPHASSAYRPDVDGLRAIAVSSVVLFHCGLWPISSGFVGVDIFFVISGYLIGGIILRQTKAGQFRLAHFYARRARRILPALFVVVTATCAVGWFLLDASEYRAVGGTAVATFLAYSNISFWRFQDYFHNHARFWPLLMTWSLGVEEQFYLLFPFLVVALRRFAWTKLCAVLAIATLASFGSALYWARVSPMGAFYLLPGRAWEFGVGVILAALEMRFGPGFCLFSDRWRQKTLNPAAWLGLLLLTIGVTGFDERTPFPGLTAVLPVLGAAFAARHPRKLGQSVSVVQQANRVCGFDFVLMVSLALAHYQLPQNHYPEHTAGMVCCDIYSNKFCIGCFLLALYREPISSLAPFASTSAASICFCSSDRPHTSSGYQIYRRISATDG